MNDVGSSVAQPLNKTLNGTISSAPREKAVYLLHSNVKILTNAIAALSKLGDEIFLQAQKHGLCLKTFNKNRSAYGIFLFADDFFSDYDTKFVCNEEVRDCRISTKAALTIFKSAHFVEKNLVSCTFTVDCLGQDLRIDFQHTYDVSRSFDVSVMERHKPFTSNIDRNDLSNAVTVSAFEISSFLNEMHTGREELILNALEDKFILKNYVPCPGDMSEGLECRTEITVQKSCFKSFSVQKPSEISFSMKEFKAIVTFARQHSCDVSLFFDKPGSPLIVAVESDAGYSGEFIIATMDGAEESDEESSPEATQGPATSASQEKQLNSQESQNVTREDESQKKRCKTPNRKRRGSQETNPQPICPTLHPDSEDEEMNAEIENYESVLRAEEQSRIMAIMQPIGYEPLDEITMEMDDPNLLLAADNVNEQRSSEEQALDDAAPMDDFELEEASPAATNQPVMETEIAEEQIETMSNIPGREVNVEFQRRFLGIGLRPQHQSQVAATANAIVEPTQLPLPDTRRR